MFLSAENDNEFSPSLSLSLLFLFFCSLNYDPAIRRKKYHLTTATLLVTINPLEPAKLFKRSGTLPSFPFPFFSPPPPFLRYCVVPLFPPIAPRYSPFSTVMNRGKLISSCLLLLDLLYSQSTRWRIQSYLHSQSFVPIYPYNTCIKNPFHSRYNRVTATKSPTKCNVPKRVGHAFPIPRSNSLACREKAKRRRISVWKQQNRRPKANSASMFRHLET